MRTGVVAVAAAGLVAGVLAQPAPGTCAEDYDCQWNYVDPYNNLFSYNFLPLCNNMNKGDMVVQDAGGHNFTFNICGYSSFKCLPKWTEKFQYGAVVQAWDSAPPCNVTDNSTMCYSYVDQQFECCSASCEVVGVGTPLWSLINPNDPVNGGVQLKYSSVPPDADSPNPCGVDTDGYTPIGRSMTFNIHCGRLIGKDFAIQGGVQEVSTCQYVINATSPLACGCQPNCVAQGQDQRICGEDGCGGYCSPPDLQGECPYAADVQQVCLYDTGLCCRPDCTGRQCGDDGCGGTCGTCGVGETCTPVQACVANPSYPPQFAITYAADAGSLTGGFVGGILTAVAAAVAYVFLLGGGRERFDKWRFADTAGGSLLRSAAVAPTAAGGSGLASAASGGGYGGLSTSGGGSYGST